jgi:hypothetical protein
MSLYAKMIAGVVLLIALAGVVWKIDRNGYNRAIAERAVADNAAIAQRIAENHDELLAQEAWRNAKDKEYQDEVSKLRTRIANSDRLRVAGCNGSAGSSETKGSTSGNGGDTGARMVSEATQRDFDALELRIETVFAGCRIAQEFIKKHE